MEKIIQYVKAGNGRGLIFLLAAAVVISFGAVVFLKQICRDVEPQVMLVADDLLPITVQGGKIVDPVGAYKTVELKFGGALDNSDVLPVVLDTREEKSTVPDVKSGVFVMTDAVYMVSPRKIEKFYLPDGVWNKDELKSYFDSFVSAFSLIVAVMMVIIFFLFLLLKMLIIAWLAKIGLNAMQKSETLDFTSFMRLSSVVVALFDVAIVALSLSCGFSLNILIKGLIELLIVVGCMLKLENKNA